VNNTKVVFWDFDGVILESNKIRDKGFEIVLAEFPKEQVRLLLDYHRANGGLSRYVKFRYFFEEIRKEEITNEKLFKLTSKFSNIMKKYLCNKELLNPFILDFIVSNYKNLHMHITSGSDQKELLYLCENLEITKYFDSINGSPTPKDELVRKLLFDNGYESDLCVLVGDSKNDLDAANSNHIKFLCYNNENLCKNQPSFSDYFRLSEK
jgi:phosphoglycolate phosphatase-like HAD superfamily hydrolase